MQAKEAGEGSRVEDAGELAARPAGEAQDAPASVQAAGAGRLHLLCCQSPARKRHLMPDRQCISRVARLPVYNLLGNRPWAVLGMCLELAW